MLASLGFYVEKAGQPGHAPFGHISAELIVIYKVFPAPGGDLQIDRGVHIFGITDPGNRHIMAADV